MFWGEMKVMFPKDHPLKVCSYLRTPLFLYLGGCIDGWWRLFLFSDLRLGDQKWLEEMVGGEAMGKVTILIF